MHLTILVTSVPNIKNINVKNFAISKFSLTAIFFVPVILMLVVWFLYMIVVVLNQLCGECCKELKEFLGNRVQDAPHIVVAQHYASKKVYQSVQKLSSKRSRNTEDEKVTEINTINPLHNNEDIETNAITNPNKDRDTTIDPDDIL